MSPPHEFVGRGTAEGGGGVLQLERLEPLHQLRWSPSPRNLGEDRLRQQQQQLGVDRRALRPLPLDEGGDVGTRDEMDFDLLMLVAAGSGLSR